MISHGTLDSLMKSSSCHRYMRAVVPGRLTFDQMKTRSTH